MNYTERLLEFLDGSLETGQEQELFYVLAGNDELRGELKQQIAIHTAVKSDSAAFTPSPTATIGLYKKLGYSIPAAFSGTVATGFLSRLLQTARTYTQGIYSGMAAAAATAIIIFSFFMPEQHEIITGSASGSENNFSGQSASNINSVPPSENKLPLIKSEERYNKPEAKKQKIKTVTKYIYVQKQSGNESQDIAKNEMSEEKPELQESEINKDRLAALNLLKNSNFKSRPLIKINPNRMIIPMNIDPGNTPETLQDSYFGYEVEVRGIENWSVPVATINPTKFREFNDLAITAFKKLNNDWEAGIEYRGENFYQKFKHSFDGDLYMIEQNPNFNTICFAVRWTPDLFNSNYLSPATQLSLGGNNYGMVGRWMAGIKYKAVTGISFIISGEGSLFIFKHQNDWYNSKKIGVNYGVSFEF